VVGRDLGLGEFRGGHSVREALNRRGSAIAPMLGWSSRSCSAVFGKLESGADFHRKGKENEGEKEVLINGKSS